MTAELPKEYPSHDEAMTALGKLIEGSYFDEAMLVGDYIGHLEAKLDIAALSLSDSVRWIPVSERVPEDDRRVLAYPSNTSYDGNPTAHHWPYGDHGGVKRGGWYQIDEHGYRYTVHVTHWMPLPEAPKEEA